MDTLLVREQYKVVRVTDSRENYAFAEAVDILDREMSGCLLNLYEGPLLRRYLPCFDRLKGSAAFRDLFLEGESLVTVFRDCGGDPIDQVFYLGDSHHWTERLYYAGELMEQVLNLSDLPPEMACALLLSENVRVDRRNRSICLRFHAVPMEEMNRREIVYLATDQLRKILRVRAGSPREELEFLDQLERGSCVTPVQLYALWRAQSLKIREAYEALEKKNVVRRWCSLLVGRVKRRIARRKER